MSMFVWRTAARNAELRTPVAPAMRPAPLPTDDLYWKEGQDAGGTGNAPQPNQPEYTNEGENAGAY